ncbi:MAG: LytTR family DNA-binding domain-containing protein [Rhodocyclaceae bacterium]|nr:LytTR family DNA-binding domain-containing protein [Rhodocyclaceae bacterium]
MFLETTLRILIVDDEAPARSRLRDLLADIAAEVPNRVVGEAADGVEALERLNDVETDVALVDIRMPRMDGIELAQHLMRLQHPPAVVFTTAYDQYAVQAFELNAVDYLLKPVRAARLADALKKAAFAPSTREALQRLAPSGRHQLHCVERDRVLLVPVADVLYFKADQKYVTARTSAREFLLEESLVHLEEEFAAAFLRIHRNCIVARQAVAGFAREHDGSEGDEAHWALLLHGVTEQLPVSRRQWPQVKAALGL